MGEGSGGKGREAGVGDTPAHPHNKTYRQQTQNYGGQGAGGREREERGREKGGKGREKREKREGERRERGRERGR